MVHDLTGDRVTLSQAFLMSGQEPGTPCSERWAGDPSASPRTWPSTRVGVRERRSAAGRDHATQDAALLDEGAKPGRGPRAEVPPVQLGGARSRE